MKQISRHNSRTKTSAKNAGMTLVETLTALGIFVCIIVAVGAFQVSIFSNQRIVAGNLQTAQDAQVILRKIATEMRSIATSASGTYPIAAAATSSFAFYSDPGDDGTNEKITYTLVGNSLMRAVIQPSGNPAVYNGANQSTTTLVTNVRNTSASPVFQYYDQNYTGTSSPLTLPINIASVRLIQVALTLDIDPSLSPVPRSYATQITLRNLKSNL